MSPEEFQSFTRKLNEKGLSFNTAGGNNLDVTNVPKKAGETVTKEVNETMSPQELKELSNKLESVDADIDLKKADLVPKKEEQPTTVAQVGSLSNEEALKMVL